MTEELITKWSWLYIMKQQQQNHNQLHHKHMARSEFDKVVRELLQLVAAGVVVLAAHGVVNKIYRSVYNDYFDQISCFWNAAYMNLPIAFRTRVSSLETRIFYWLYSTNVSRFSWNYWKHYITTLVIYLAIESKMMFVFIGVTPWT